MKIDDVSLTLFKWSGIPMANYYRGLRHSADSDLGLLRIRTDAGVEGNAFLGSASNPASMDAAQLIRSLKPLLEGQDPLQRERIHASMRLASRIVSYRTIGAVDVALWDLAGKIAKLPVHALMGTYRTSIPAYASSPTLRDVGAYVEEALRVKEEGWAGYKIHPPGEQELDIAVCTAVRKAVGERYCLMLDSTWSYTYPQALRVGRAIEELGYHWFEDPLGDEDIHHYSRLCEKLDIPILATEFPAGGLDTYPIWIANKATDFLRGDIPNKGGLTTMLKTAHLAEAFGMNYEVHHSSNSLNNLANLHLCMAVRNTTMFEVMLPPLDHGLKSRLQIDREGKMQAPTGDGLGADIDFDLIERTTTAVLR